MPFKPGKSGNPAGPAKGTKKKATIEKEAARAALRQLVLERMEVLVEAQVKNAQGIKYLMARNKKGGQFKRVTEDMAKAYADGTLSQDDDIIEVWEKDPSVQAFTDLMNRALDKPAEQESTVNLNIQDAAKLALLEAGRKRAFGK
jgi:hypothetical protein